MMGKIKQVMQLVEDHAHDAGREQAADAYYLYQDFMHEQRDEVREAIELAIMNTLDDETGNLMEMDDFYAWMGFGDDDDYHSWLDEQASEALIDEGFTDV